MIAQDFEYYKPDSVKEALQTYSHLKSIGKKPLYYGGGTEIITMCRAGTLSCDAVIDIKGIRECRELGFSGDSLYMGSGVTLIDIDESKTFPVLGAVGARVADHSVQGKITLGGNLAGTIIYRETALPLLLCDAAASVASPGRPGELLEVPLKDVFTGGRLTLEQGGFLVGVTVKRQDTEAPWFHVKRTKMEEVGYPLLTLVALMFHNRIRLAASGLYPYPVMLEPLEGLGSPEGPEGDEQPSVKKAKYSEKESANRGKSFPEKISAALERLPPGILDDMDGSADYRRFIMSRVLEDCLAQMEAS